MNNSPAAFWLILFAAAAVTVSVAALIENTTVYNVVKPMLIPALLLWLLSQKNIIAADNKLIIAGLFFSWAGDVLLMFESRGALFFIFGLLCFLITHICYIIYFLSIKSPQPSLMRKQPWMAALLAAYVCSLVMLLLPHLGELKIPVMIYAVVICTMAICSLHVFYKVNNPANILFAAGALLFAASDSLLAINKFYKPFPLAALLIIFTYCLAQFGIVMGVVKRK
jgi:uncharacterized membrane protein YhhN